MNKLIFVFGIVLISFSTLAQSFPFKIQKSDVFKDEYKESEIVLYQDGGNGGILIVRSYVAGISAKKGFYIEHYDKDLKLTKEFEYEITHTITEKFNLVLGVCSFNNEIQIVEIYYDLKQKSYICQANVISEDFNISKKELFRLTKEDVKKVGYFNLESTFNERIGKIWTNDISGDISKIDNAFDFSFNFYNRQPITKGNKPDIVMTVNEAKNAFAISIDYNAKNSEYLKLYLFDKELNKKIETEFSREINDKKYNFQNIQVDPNGNYIYLLGKAYTELQDKKKEGGKYLFELTKINSDSQKSQLININENFIGSLKSVFHNNQLICIGFYSEINDFQYKGISYFKLDTNSLEILQSKYNPFSEQFMVDKYGEEKDKELKYLTLKNYFFTKNDELLLNAQEEYLTISSSGSGMNGFGGGTRTYASYDDIVSAKLSVDGDLVWARNINKKQGFQNSENENYVSYTAAIVGDMPYYFINAGERVKELDDKRIEFKDSNKNKANINLIRIKEDGDFEYEKILENEENEVPFVVSKEV
ncbi:hypothetical protein [Flavobacterium sp. N3904]|uniref:hypothetical protein n=1 Tax=Flavobacterium sp. N3904 TaxID=2986835 RepID=UPI0022244F34|nr:hypothetical protein [Flavobacterium sp. N3904]